MTVFALLILAAMTALVPRAPWEASLSESAVAIATAAEERPLCAGELGAARTAAVLTAIAYHESRFDPRAVGDQGQSRGLYQISRAMAPEQDRASALEQSRAARELVRTSLRICRGAAARDQLGWYAAGGNGCRGLGASRVRMVTAERVLGMLRP